MIKAILFDLDGTIADTIPAITEGINLTMRHRGYPTHDEAAVRTFINYGSRQLVRSAMPKELQDDEALLDAVHTDYNGFYGQTYDHTTETYEGIPALIETLHSMGLKIGVLSNKQDLYVKKLCEQLLPEGLCGTAQGVLPGGKPKPDPALSERVAAALGVRTEECIMIGDSNVDFYTAQNAGMTHVGVSWGYRDEAFLREIGVTRVAHNPNELLQIIKSLL